MKKYLKIVLLVIVAIILVGTFVFLYQKSRPKVVVYETLKPEVTDLQKTTVATGKVEPRDEILIKPQISGIIDEVYKEAGQAVRKGEVIAKVKVIPELGQLNSAESRVRLAEINATQAETDFSRVKKLYEDQLISREEYEKSEVAVKQAREEKQTAKDNLEIVKEGITKNSASFSSTMIRSTIDGLILDVPVKAGNSVIMSNTFNDGTTIATVANMNDLIFRGNIDETEVGRIHEGMPLKLTIGALQNLTFNAILEYISPKGVETNGANQFEIKAAISVPDSVQVRSGYSANAEIVLQRANKVLAVPESTVEFKGDSTFVYIMTDSVPEQKFQRTQDQLISREEYEKSEVAVKQAREEKQTAKDNLEIVKEGITKNSASFSSTMIRSTIDGLILDVPVKAGNSVIMSNTFNDGTTIATVANMNDLIFRGNIDETEVGRIHEGMPLKLTIGALQNLTFNAILEYISPKGVETNGANQFEIKAAISVPDSVQVRSGYSANAEIVLQRANKVLAVPESTVEFKGDSTFVYIMTDSVPEQKFQRTQVTTGMSDGIKIEIKKGVTANDKIRGAEKKDK